MFIKILIKVITKHKHLRHWSVTPKLGLRPFCMVSIKFVFAVEPELEKTCFQSTVVVVVNGENVNGAGVVYQAVGWVQLVHLVVVVTKMG
ncbi:hypothetical protein BpHYR1_035535 [Brachionus plicatilis]|uniref:Uncharacterized protein n=1 Tax=Brachionus plicatilis TaxID=10195 RepID=A0A3M7SAD0_BRAPC|nr:hypothetical protein BpHYR1_035535 [Brachionus plicatilis]